jgi:Caspase domain
MAKNDWAIVVGIDTYFDSSLPPLQGPENDAEAFYDWVTHSAGGGVPKDQAFRILSSAFQTPFASIADAKPTAAEIVELFDRLRARAAANAASEEGIGYHVGDRIWLFFAGHGFAPSHRQDQTALLVADADTAGAQLAHILGTYMADTLYQLKLFDEVFLFMDCCRSTSECAQLFMPYGDDKAEDYWKVRRFYAYGARAGKEARERDFGDGKVHGIFTRTLLDALRGAAYDPEDPSKITAESLQNVLYNAYPEHMDPQLRADPNVPNEPEVVFERKPEKLVVGPSTGMLGRFMAGTPKFPVRLRTTAHAGKNGYVLDRNLQPVRRLKLEAETDVELERGLYALFVPGAPPKHFEVTGASGMVDVPLHEATTVKLTVTAADAATELYVVDGDFNLVARGIGTETFQVAPGIYKIKARAALQQEERLVVVSDDAKVEFAPLELASPVPLANTAGTTDEQIASAQRVVAQVGHGASIAVIRAGAAKKLRLLRSDGSEVAEIGDSVHVALEPDGYRLTAELDGGRIVEQTLVAARGWQTRVFAAANVAQSAISMRPEGTPFDPHDTDARLEEIARQAIVHGRKVLSDELRTRLASPGVSPILGILGMHLLIREAKRSKQAREENPEVELEEISSVESVAAIVGNLRAAIGKHPDVEAIAIGAGVGDPAYAFDVPPMLALSWRLLLKATAQRPELLPRGSFGERIASRLWGDGAWLQWLAAESDRVDRDAAAQESLERALTQLGAAPIRVAAPVDAGGWLKSFMSRFLTTGELPLTSMAAEPFDFSRVKEKLDLERKRKLIKQLGVPMATLEAWLASMERESGIE